MNLRKIKIGLFTFILNECGIATLIFLFFCCVLYFLFLLFYFISVRFVLFHSHCVSVAATLSHIVIVRSTFTQSLFAFIVTCKYLISTFNKNLCNNMQLHLLCYNFWINCRDISTNKNGIHCNTHRNLYSARSVCFRYFNKRRQRNVRQRVQITRRKESGAFVNQPRSDGHERLFLVWLLDICRKWYEMGRRENKEPM